MKRTNEIKMPAHLLCGHIGHCEIRETFDTFDQLNEWLWNRDLDHEEFFVDEDSDIYLEHEPMSWAYLEDPSWKEYVDNHSEF